MLNPSMTSIVVALSIAVSAFVSAQESTVVGSIPAEFAVSNGTANYSIPIAVAPGRGGMQPELLLNYSSGGGNGVLGIGWSLGGLSAISRCPRSIVQDGAVGGINFNANDRYCLDGQRLIPVNGPNGGVGTEYKTEVDGYSQIVSYGGSVNNPAYWEVKTKAGQVITYGGAGNATQAFPKGNLVWAIRSVNDSTGNNPITYDYFIDGNTQYLDEINYSSGQIRLEYEARSDTSPSYAIGGYTLTNNRLAATKVYGRNSLLKSYLLSYENSGTVKHSRLISIQECDRLSRCLETTSFHWQNGGQNLSFTGSGNGGTHAYWDRVVNSSKYKGQSFTGDFNGDGKTDLMMIYRDPDSSKVSIYHWHSDENGKLIFAGTGNGGTHAYWNTVIDSNLWCTLKV